MNNVVPELTREQFEANFAEIHPPLDAQAAVVEANRCLFCFDAPCTNACPTHIDVPRFIKKIATGNLAGSALAILDANILGLSCSRVCPVDVLCEGACVMHRYNKQPIEIGRLQRHAMDAFYDRGGRLPPSRSPRRGRVACIGAGPASLACAAELARLGFAVTVIDKRDRAGGLNTYGVAEYKFRPADSEKEVALVRSLGVEFRLGVEVTSVDDLEREFDILFIGVGLGSTHALGIPGEGLAGVIDALHFIAEYKTNGGARVGRRVVVVGGGNTAIDAATAARRLGAAEVRMVYRRDESEMPAFRFEVELARQDGVTFHWNTQPVAIHGNGVVESVECVRMERMQPVSGSNFRLECDTVIPSIGQSKLVEFLARCRGVELNAGRVVADAHTGRTANPRYYAGGDCVNGGREVVDAVAEGKRAALEIARRLEEIHG
ncbi:MAG: NAD(P)-dependent oxidoreductase [Gemmatimonadetes bacterium]|nr:NAD(P)-dependent oxidoreductase [Gemmatimonadota bacterium]